MIQKTHDGPPPTARLTMRTDEVSDQMLQDQQDGQAAPGKKRVPYGQRLAQATPADVIPMVEALASFNGPASKNMVAGYMGLTAGGGAFEGKWAATGYYGFREGAGNGRFQISERGRGLVSGDTAAVLEAKQHALVSTGFRVVLDRFSTNPVNLPAIEAVLEEDLGVPASQVEKMAKLLVKSAEDAEMVVDNRFQVAAIEPAIEAVGDVTVAVTSRLSTNGTTKPNGTGQSTHATRPATARRQAPPSPRAPIVQTVEAEGKAGPFDVSVEIRIDAKEHTPKEIGEIVREVRAALTLAA